MLNNGRDPQNKGAGIDPAVPGWKEFIPGTEYGLALTTDGRVFCVGEESSSCGLHGRYTHVATSEDRNIVGIRMNDGGIDFAGKNANGIKNDITEAGLTGVRDIAAGPDRAVAITSGGGVWSFGNYNKDWDPYYISQRNSLTGDYTSISVAHINKDTIFVAFKNPAANDVSSGI